MVSIMAFLILLGEEKKTSEKNGPSEGAASYHSPRLSPALEARGGAGGASLGCGPARSGFRLR